MNIINEHIILTEGLYYIDVPRGIFCRKKIFHFHCTIQGTTQQNADVWFPERILAMQISFKLVRGTWKPCHMIVFGGSYCEPQKAWCEFGTRVCISSHFHEGVPGEISKGVSGEILSSVQQLR